MATWIQRLDVVGDGPRLAVKDAIDVAGLPTTVGCAAIADVATAATADAPCVATARQQGAVIVGKTNLHELCYGITGINPWFGTPVNPLDPARVPGGSSSGSAVAVANREADIAYGTDTGGSVRIPAACCAVTGLKTTHSRITTDGVWPLSPSLDTVGPLARDMAGVILGMQFLEPGFAVSTAATSIGRVRRPDVDPRIDREVDAAIAAAGFDVIDIDLPGWADADHALEVIIGAEAWHADRHLLDQRPDRVGDVVSRRLREGSGFSPEQVTTARANQQAWRAELADLFTRVQLIALPTMAVDPNLMGGGPRQPMNTLTRVFNVAGVPALSLPVGPGPLPASLQLVGPQRAEELLCATGLVVEAAAPCAVRW